MARGRMIDKRLCKSKKFANLKYDRSRVLYVLMYTHADCEGKFLGDPEEIKVDCCPYLPYTIRRVAESVIELADAGLINLYEKNDKPYIKFCAFEQFQIGIRRDREAPSVIPNPDEVRSKSGSTPALYLRLKLKKERKKEDEDPTEIESSLKRSKEIRKRLMMEATPRIEAARKEKDGKAYEKIMAEIDENTAQEINKRIEP